MIPRLIQIVAACVRFAGVPLWEQGSCLLLIVRHVPNTSRKSGGHVLLLFNKFPNGERVAFFSSVDVRQKELKEIEE